MDIKAIRGQIGLSQREFADKFDIPVKTLQRWEQGQNEPPKYVIGMIETILANELKGEQNGQ